MRYRRLIGALLLLGAGKVFAQAGGDSLAMPAAGKADSARADSARARPLDPAYAWKAWKDLSRAIALRPLDGPDDILEKAEIITDRLDDLRQERKALQTELEKWKDRQQSLELQMEVLEDLAQVQRGGDLQLQQRLHGLREDLGRAARRIGVLKGALGELDEELSRLDGLAAAYARKAAELRRREEENR